MKLLLVEDAERLRNTLHHGLQSAGFIVDSAKDGLEARAYLASYSYELVVLDLMMPRLDGIGVLRHLSVERERPAVLVISARDRTADRIEALSAGADDYLVKPFAFDELMARLWALLRRPRPWRANVLTYEKLRLDSNSCSAYVNEQRLALTPREFAVLGLLLHNRGRILSRAEILERTAGTNSGSADTSVEVIIYGLRQKLGFSGMSNVIKTRRGLGYIIDLIPLSQVTRE